MKILFGKKAERIKRIIEREERENDLHYLAKLIIRYCKENNCIGVSTPMIEGIVKFEFKEAKVKYD